MLGYWLLFMVPATMAVMSLGRPGRRSRLAWWLVGLFYALAIGWRYEVGGDWFNYLWRLADYRWVTLSDALWTSDPGYAFFTWMSVQLGWEVYGVNMACALLFTFGLLVFCRSQGNQWLALAVAVPYILIVVAMGYTRQGVALGFIFWALSSLERGNFVRYLILVTFAALFHKTALVMIPLGLFVERRGWIFRIVAVLVSGFVLWDLLLADKQAHLWKHYVEAEMESRGAMIRVGMNLIPAMIFLFLRNRWCEKFRHYAFWMALSLGAIGCELFVPFASTAVDRIALYLTPLQVAVFARLPDLLEGKFSRQTVTVAIVLGYAAVLFVWLNYANHAEYWLPYRNWLLM